MSMFRRSRKPAPPLHRKQQEIAQQEAQLREKVESLQRIVTQSQAPALTKPSKRKPDDKASNNFGEKRFHVSIAMEAPQLFDTDQRRRRPRALRKERRQGQIIFLILLVALAFAVMWLISHLHP
ncbi:MAG TPA: hypothetical protein VL912_10805 [Candidatus Udaeobacter sp.]|nr:hypothetical protein [Candidatus Udaeobacter sp.]